MCALSKFEDTFYTKYGIMFDDHKNTTYMFPIENNMKLIYYLLKLRVYKKKTTKNDQTNNFDEF